MFDAYTIKKVLPRLVIAVIVIQLSWFILTGAIALTNLISFGLEALIAAPFGGTQALELQSVLTGTNKPGDVSVLFGLGAAAAVGVIGAGGILALGTFILMALLVGFFTLVLRRVLLIALLIVAPIAIVAWILPGTQRLWKLWWDNFSKLLLMFPLIIVMLTAGKALASVTVSSDTGDPAKVVMAYATFFAPFFMIPLTYKMAGAGLALASGFMKNKTDPLTGMMQKRGRAKQQQSMQEMKAGTKFSGSRFVPGSRAAADRLNRITRGTGTGVKGGFGLGRRGAEASDQTLRTAVGDLSKTAAAQSIAEDDGALRAATYGNFQEAVTGLQNDFGMNQADAERAARAASTSVGFNQAAAVFAAQRLVSTGTGYDNMAQMTQTLARAAGGNASTGASLAGFANAETKRVGRAELAPGFGNLNNLVQRQMSGMPPGDADFAGATRAAWDSVDVGTVVRGKAPQTKAFADFQLERLQNGNQVEKREAAIALMELQKNLPGANGGSQRVINQAMDRLRTEAGHVGIDYSAPLEQQLAAIATAPGSGAQAVDLQGNMLTPETISGMARIYDSSYPLSERGGAPEPPAAAPPPGGAQ